MVHYTKQEEKELNAELKKWQNSAKRLILSDYYDSAAEQLNEIDFSVLQRITNAENYKDINTYLWSSGMIEKDMAGKGWEIDLNQGMDARLVTEEIADILASLQWIKYIRFSCDTIGQIKPISRVAEMLEKRGIKPYRLFIYVLVRKDLDEADYRVQQLKRHKGIHLYAQAERNEGLGIRPNKAQLEFTNRYIYGNLYRKESWKEYLSKRPWVRQRLEEKRSVDIANKKEVV